MRIPFFDENNSNPELAKSISFDFNEADKHITVHVAGTVAATIRYHPIKNAVQLSIADGTRTLDGTTMLLAACQQATEELAVRLEPGKDDRALLAFVNLYSLEREEKIVRSLTVESVIERFNYHIQGEPWDNCPAMSILNALIEFSNQSQAAQRAFITQITADVCEIEHAYCAAAYYFVHGYEAVCRLEFDTATFGITGNLGNQFYSHHMKSKMAWFRDAYR